MFALPLTLSKFIKEWWLAFAGAALFGALLTLAYCNGRSDGRQREAVKQQEREIETQRDLGRANEDASGRRMEYVTKAARQEKELTDALNATKDPDRQRALRGCLILRQQGTDTSDIPACR